MQLDELTRNAMADVLEQHIGPSPTLRFRSGAKPANCAAADSGVVLGTIVLPVDWLTPASGGAKAKNGAWVDPAADAAGVIGHFRMYDAGGACKMQGTVTLAGGGGDVIVDNLNTTIGLPITVTAFGITAGNP